MTTGLPALTPEQTEHFSQRLDQEAKHLGEVIAGLLQGIASPGHEGEHEAALDEDAAADFSQQEQFGVQTRDLENALREVKLAQERLAAGTYGRCSDCGQPIPLARLEFLPTAERDVTCESKRETSRRR